MRERIPMDTLLHNLQVGSISRVGHIAEIIDTLKNTPTEDLNIYVNGSEKQVEDVDDEKQVDAGEDSGSETYGELASRIKTNPPRNKDALIMSMASSLLAMANPYRRRERNM